MNSSRRDFVRTLGMAGVGFATGPAGLSAAMRMASNVVIDPYAIVLGIAQDAGMPQVGCYADRCNKARERGQPRFASS
ncbi:MAG: twin-arginine translocation signal domain-containing protein, partial [Longimicrobiales bacterium]